MKKIYSLLIFTAITIASFTSCQSDDNSSESGNLADIQNATEETVIPLVSLESGITIEDASKESGIPPAPNSQLDFNLNTELTEAFQQTGFKIQLSSDQEIAGAYILFKDTEGNSNGDYFDVPSSAFEEAYGKSTKSSETRKLNIFNKSKSTAKSSKAVEDFTDEIQIDFDATLPAGEFCYEICLYDRNNNVSQIQTICVTVEAWGGNESIVGEWVIDEVDIDDTETLECDNGNQITAEYELYVKREILVVFNENGSYYFMNDIESSDLNEDATKNSCTAIYEDETYRFSIKNSGNWAFNEDNQTLTAIDFTHENLLDPEENEEYTEGRVQFEGYGVEVIANQLILTFTEGDDPVRLSFNRK